MAQRDFISAVREHQPKLHRTACFLAGDRREGGELLQDTLLKAWLGWDESAARDPMYPWLCGILARCREQRQRGQKASATKAMAAWPSDSQTALLWELVGSLPPRPREVFVLRYAEEMNVEQIAEALGETPATVRSRLGEAHAQVGERLRRAGIGKPRP